MVNQYLMTQRDFCGRWLTEYKAVPIGL